MEARAIGQDFREMVTLAGPVVVGQLASIGMQTTDIALVGHFDSSLLGGMALGHTLFFTMLLVGMGVVQGLSPIISQSYGAGALRSCGHALVQTAYVGLVLGLLMMGVLQYGETLLLSTGQSAEQARIAQRYLTPLAFCCVPTFLFQTLRQLVEGVSATRPIMLISLLGLAVNALVCYGLLHGTFGFPSLGLEGAGWATTFTQTFICALLGGYCLLSERFKPFALRDALSWPEWAFVQQLLRLGVPIAVSMGMEVGAFSAAALFMGWLGPTPMAAHQVALTLASTTFMVPLGISIAGSVRVGQAVGRGDWMGMRRAGWLTFGMAGAVMLVNAGVFLTFPRLLLGVYTQDEAILALGMQLLQVAAAFQLFDGLQVAGMGVLRGLKDTRVPMLATMLAYWACGMPCSYVLGIWAGWGPMGIWMGLSTGLIIAAACHIARFIWLTHKKGPGASPWQGEGLGEGA